MALAYELAEQGAMNEEEDPDWHKNYLKRLRASLMPTEQKVSRSTSPFSHAALHYNKSEVEMRPAASRLSFARMINQVEHDEAQMSDIFPERTEFLRHSYRHQSDTYSQDRTDSQQLLPELTASASSTRTPTEPVERAIKTSSVAHYSAPMQLLRQKQKRTVRDSDSSKRLSAKVSNKDRKLLDQILEGEGLEEQIEMIRQQELKCVQVSLFRNPQTVQISILYRL